MTHTRATTGTQDWRGPAQHTAARSCSEQVPCAKEARSCPMGDVCPAAKSPANQLRSKASTDRLHWPATPHRRRPSAITRRTGTCVLTFAAS